MEMLCCFFSHNPWISFFLVSGLLIYLYNFFRKLNNFCYFLAQEKVDPHETGCEAGCPHLAGGQGKMQFLLTFSVGVFDTERIHMNLHYGSGSRK